MRKKILTLFLLVFAVVEVITVIAVQPKPFRYSSSVETPSAPGAFEQYEQYPGPNPEPEKNSYVAIRHHFGEVRAYEPIFDLNIFRQTDRCGLNTGCPLLTGADLLSWSPNRLVLEGQPGALARLNMNNANGWMENEHRLAQTNRILDNQQGITVTIPPSGQVTLTYRPVGAWLMYGSLGLLLCYCLLAFVARRFNTLNNE